MVNENNYEDKRFVSWERRKFLSTVLTLSASSVVIPQVQAAADFFKSKEVFTVQQIIDIILREIPGAPFKQTVDTIKAGRADQVVTGIVTTSFATEDVITKAIALRANFIIAHEPTFYSHTDETGSLADNRVYTHKRQLLDSNNIAVWRFHDYWHSHRPDGVLMGVLTALNWQKYYDEKNPHIITLPATSLGNINAHLKKALGITRLKVIGDPSSLCRRIALMPGAAGGTAQINLVEKQKPDLLIVGEVHEWETAEYIRDGRFKRNGTALSVLGHAVSEEAGMQWLVQWLIPKVPGIKVTHIPSKDPFTYA